jgi:hypothetical protein
MSLYLHRPTATDPGVAPPGHDAFYGLCDRPGRTVASRRAAMRCRNGSARAAQSCPPARFVLGPRYRGLLDDIFSRKVLAEDMSLYLHRPTATDPGGPPRAEIPDEHAHRGLRPAQPPLAPAPRLRREQPLRPRSCSVRATAGSSTTSSPARCWPRT